MNCARARFLLYACLDREASASETESLSRHVAACGPCAARAQSARNLVRLLRSRIDRTPAPLRLRARLQGGFLLEPSRPRYPLFAATAAALLLLAVVPLASDDPRPRVAATGALPLADPAAPGRPGVALVSRQMTGTFVCLDCEARAEAGLCPLPEGAHEAGFCAENGEVWRLMVREAASGNVGRTATVEGVAFPESGFLRVSRVGY